VPVLDESVRVDDGSVWILDRRVFPASIEWLRADSALEVAAAITAMVTQSSGPTYAACAGMELAALQAAHPREATAAVEAALVGETTTAGIVTAAIEAAREFAATYRRRSRVLGEHAVALLDDGARLLTHCWMDAYLIELVRAAEDAGKSFEWVATETRPYLQGARLTAHTLREMGQRVTLITDGMAAAALAPGSTIGPIDAVVTAADRVSLDGSVANKVGTLGIAVAASAFGVPYFALVQAPDASLPTGSDIVIEERDATEVLYSLGARTASDLVTDAWYPAFDVTPPRFVTAVVTDRGAFPPASLSTYFTLPPALIPMDRDAR
jgi:methylthioribose-1-phosphate isomerase